MSSGPSAMSVKITTQFSITIVVTILVQGTVGHLLPRGNMAIWNMSANIILVVINDYPSIVNYSLSRLFAFYFTNLAQFTKSGRRKTKSNLSLRTSSLYPR